MKKLQRNKQFEKHFKIRISPNQKLENQFNQRLEMFLAGERNYPLDDHPLSGKLEGKRAFSVANDVRVIYAETDDAIIFLDVGSHNQVYR